MPLGLSVGTLQPSRPILPAMCVIIAIDFAYTCNFTMRSVICLSQVFRNTDSLHLHRLGISKGRGKWK